MKYEYATSSEVAKRMNELDNGSEYRAASGLANEKQVKPTGSDESNRKGGIMHQ